MTTKPKPPSGVRHQTGTRMTAQIAMPDINAPHRPHRLASHSSAPVGVNKPRKIGNGKTSIDRGKVTPVNAPRTSARDTNTRAAAMAAVAAASRAQATPGFRRAAHRVR